jgi:hypothetical protein
MRFPPASLGGRLFLVAALLIVAALAGAGTITGLILFRFVQAEVDQQLDTKIAAISSALNVASDNHLALGRQIETQPFDQPGSGWYYEIVDGEDRIRSSNLGSADLRLPPLRFLDWSHCPAAADGPYLGRQALNFCVGSATVGGHEITIVATAPGSAVWRPLFKALSPVLIALALTGVSLVMAVLLQVRFGLRPLHALRAAVADVRAGRRARVPTDQPIEIAPLVDELNNLIADNIEGLVRARRHVSNLAHGLKTPLATLAVALDERGRDPDGALHVLIDQMDRRIRHHLGRARTAALRGPARVRTELAGRVGDLIAIVPKIRKGVPLIATADVVPQIAVACDVALR